MRIIGLTGGIASGKSTVAKMLVEKGAHLLDADRLAREAVEPEQPAWKQIVAWLGEDILLPDRSINRVKLANLVFNDRRMLDKLNKIVHPSVGRRLVELSQELRDKEPDAVIIYDIPLLIEAGMQKMVDLVLLVYATPEVQLSRLQQRDGLSRADAEKRIKAQKPLEEKKRHAGAIIDNSKTLAETAHQVDQFWDKFMQGGYKCTQ
jgi:dephospho-CoA kinase